MPMLALALALLCAMSSTGCSSPTSPPKPDTATDTPPQQSTLSSSQPERPTRMHALPDLPIGQLEGMFKGQLVKQLMFEDMDGQGLLLLSRSEETLEEGADGDSANQVTLHSQLFSRADPTTNWSSRWKVEQPTRCEGLDLEADFFPDQSRLTDLDADGRAELTFASHSFCGGGIDSQELRIDVRQGDQQHYVVHGSSLVQIEGDTPFGGERHDEPDALNAPAPIRAHLDAVWSAIKRGPAP